jgi:hypothetical protein
MPDDLRRFVILEHQWEGIHWDLMVETDPSGPLRTWAIDSEPVPGRDLPARALADHRREYLTYEGEVSGGRGTVRRWDEGTCSVEVWGPERVRLVLDGNQLDGVAELRSVEGIGPGIPSASGAGGASGTSWVFCLGKLS